MKISRTGTCPAFLDYVTTRALVPRSAELEPEFVRLTQYNFSWIDIPSYQRGLVWDDDLFEDLLDSSSVFLGNAVLGAFPVPENRQGFENLPKDANEYEILIDGLQRFSIGTSLLSILHPLVFSDSPSRPDDVPHFANLKAQCAGKGPVYAQNDKELKKHARKAVRESYIKFRATLARWIEREFDEGRAQELGEKLTRLFLGRQVAPDTYHGFANPYAVTNTFIGLNTVRVQLHIVDWLRSIVVDQGSASGWEPIETEDLENRFTEVFTKDGSSPNRELIPLAALVKDALTGDDIDKALAVFPSWCGESGPSLTIEEVRAFLDFVESMVQHKINPCFREIRLCGAIPFTGLICHYYRQFLKSGQRPGFLEGGELENTDLLAYLRGYYRVLFDGQVARTRSFVEKLLYSDIDLQQTADDLSRHYIQRKLEQPADRDWLVATLKQTDQKRSMRVFNACRLPVHGESGQFVPDNYGRKGKDDYQIDHLIPDSVVEQNLPGGPETQLIMNFAPVRRPVNNKQSNITCSTKLSSGGSFANEIKSNPSTHPFVVWLVDEQGKHGSYLDRQDLLQPNSDPPIANERIQWLADRLLTRL